MPGSEDIEGVNLTDAIEEQIIRAFGDDLSQEDYAESFREIEESLK
jgi:hypothetical protein